MRIDNHDIFACYRDLWKAKSEKRNAIRRGIISDDGCTENCIKLRINTADKSTGNKQDKAIADTYGNKFVIPLDFEMLDSALPYYQAGLGNRFRLHETYDHWSVAVLTVTVHSSFFPNFDFLQICCFLHWIQSVNSHFYVTLYYNGSPYICDS